MKTPTFVLGTLPVNAKHPKRFDRVAFLDLELTMREDNPGDSFEPEIVEIGLVIADTLDWAVVSSHEWFIKPKKTVIGDHFLAFKGDCEEPAVRIPIEQALKEMRGTGVGQLVSVGFGLDWHVLEKVAPGLLSNSYIDMSAVAAFLVGDRKSLYYLTNRVASRYIGTELREHSALDDATMLMHLTRALQNGYL